MFAIPLFRVILVLSAMLLLLDQSSSHRQFIKGLLLGGLLGHGKSHFNVRKEYKEHDHHVSHVVPLYITHRTPCEHHIDFQHNGQHLGGHEGFESLEGVGEHEDLHNNGVLEHKGVLEHNGVLEHKGVLEHNEVLEHKGVLEHNGVLEHKGVLEHSSHDSYEDIGEQ